MARVRVPGPSMGMPANGKSDGLTESEAIKIRMALRDLIWRVDHLRDTVEKTQDPLDLKDVLDLLDTSEARAVLRYPSRF